MIRTIILFFITTGLSFAAPQLGEVPPTLADYLRPIPSTNPGDTGWVADLTGLPDKDQVEQLTQHVIEVMNEDSDKECTSIDSNLRLLVFQNFVIYQHMANAQNLYLDEQTAGKWGHLLAMILKESSGDSTNVTDMSGKSLKSKSNDLQHWRDLFLQSKVKLNPETNFGLTQLSADRLFNVFQLTKSQAIDLSFLEGKEGYLTPNKIKLNTAIATRRLIWFYQDFAEGRIAQSDWRIPEKDITDPKFSAQYQNAIKMALLYCGTRFMFHEEPDVAKLENAMSEIAYCKLGNPQNGFGVNELDEKCFAQWVTLCPALNIDIATITPLHYFATRNLTAVCKDTFNKLIVKSPK